MEFLDPKKQKAHLIRLFIGYVLVAIALILTTLILLYQAYGFGIKNGEVIQSGLVFISTRPGPADIYMNDTKRSETTNTRLLIPSGHYTFKLERAGYRTWQRAINVEGGSVLHFDYPMLFPAKLTTTSVSAYNAAPGLITQSPDRRWVLVQSPAAYNVFDLYDLDNPTKVAVPLTLPPTAFIHAEGAHSWEFVAWGNDDRHVLLKHVTDNNGAQTSEYVLIDRQDAQATVNLTSKLGVNPTKLELRGDKYDKYYVYDAETATLKTATLDAPAPQPFLDHVLAFKSHGDSVVLYATDQDAPAGKSLVKLRDSNQTYTIRQVSSGSNYLLDLAQYSGAWYIVAGASADSRTYVYEDPAKALRSKPDSPVVPVQVLKVQSPDYISFSDNARFIMVENGPQFGLYDAETDKGYAYTQPKALDAPQLHATWMDGHRMMYVSGGKVFVFEYDNANREVLNAALPGYVPFFDANYKALYSVGAQTVKAADGTDKTTYAINSTALLLPKDQ